MAISQANSLGRRYYQPTANIRITFDSTKQILPIQPISSPTEMSFVQNGVKLIDSMKMKMKMKLDSTYLVWL